MIETAENQNWGPRPGDTIDGRYRLQRVVDKGGMGMVVLAEHLRMRRSVAIKLLHPNIAGKPGYRARFEREVELANAIDHPNVVQCLDFGETSENYLFLVMEMLEGRSLKDKLYEDGRLSTRETIEIGLQLLDGMAAAHLADVIHRDLKPGNIWIGEDHRGRDVVKILDFGLAKDLTSNDLRITQTGSILGTASYLAPESIVVSQGGKESDVYALGLVLLEMLLGQKVFTGKNMTQAFLQQLMLPAQIPRRVWETDFGQIIADALRKHPSERPRDAEEMYQALVRAEVDVADFRLADSEIPPRNDESVAPAFLHELGAGRYRDLETLRTLPRPEPYDQGAPVVDYGQTQRIVLDTLSSIDLTPVSDNTPGGAATPRPPGLVVAEGGMPTTRFERGLDVAAATGSRTPIPGRSQAEAARLEGADTVPSLNPKRGESATDARPNRSGIAVVVLLLVVLTAGIAAWALSGVNEAVDEPGAPEAATAHSQEPALTRVEPDLQTVPAAAEDSEDGEQAGSKSEPDSAARIDRDAEEEPVAVNADETKPAKEVAAIPKAAVAEKKEAPKSPTVESKRRDSRKKAERRKKVEDDGEGQPQSGEQAEPKKEQTEPPSDPRQWRIKAEEKPSWDEHLRLSP